MSPLRSSFEEYCGRFQAALFGRIPEHVRRLRWTSAEIAAAQRDRLRRLLRHAIDHSPFHARRLAGVDPERFELEQLADLPVMTKSQMMEHFDDVLTDRRLSLALVEETLARTKDAPIPIYGEYVCQTSGGSSGRRGVFVLDTDAIADFSASLLRPTVARGGGLPPEGMKIAFVAAPSAVHATGIPSSLLEGTPVRFFQAPASLPIGELVERLNAIGPNALYGYPSMLARLAVEQRAGRLRIAPALVRTTSETLLPEHRQAIRDAFGAPLMDTFGSSEGLVGVSEPDDAALVFASDVCIVEPVDDDHRPVTVGQPSAKVLVTNLSNGVQPLVRYAMEDAFIQQPSAADHGHFRATVRGRSDEVLRYGGVDLHPIVVRAVLVKTPEVVDYQIRQTARGIDATLVADGWLDGDALRERLRVALRAAGLEGPEVRLEVAPTLERNAGTAKLRRFVPLPSTPPGSR